MVNCAFETENTGSLRSLCALDEVRSHDLLEELGYDRLNQIDIKCVKKINKHDIT
jgi:hypothetical protein